MNELELTTTNGLPVFPGGRYRRDGPGSAQEFRDDLLVPALGDHDRVKVVLDGAAGFADCFLEEVFGGLVREHGMDRDFLAERLTIETSEEDLRECVPKARAHIEKAFADRRIAMLNAKVAA